MASRKERERGQEAAFVFCFATPHSLETFLVLSYVLFVGPPRKEGERTKGTDGRTAAAERAFRFLAAACDGDSQEFPTWWYQYASMRVHVQCRTKKYSHVSGIVLNCFHNWQKCSASMAVAVGRFWIGG